MKTAKKVLAILLSIAMLLGMGATSAFAVEIGDGISWTHVYEDGEEYVYYVEFGGTLNEGVNSLTSSNEGFYNKAYEFEAAQAGYYFIQTDWWIAIAEEYQNGEAKNSSDYVGMFYQTDEEEVYGKVYYLPADTALIIAETYYGYENELSIEYLGDILEIDFDEKDLECFIFGHNVEYLEEDNIVGFPADYTATFSNGKVLNSVDYNYVYCETNGALVKGENVVTFDFLGYETEIYPTFYEITDFVESIELQKYEEHLDAKYYYDGIIEYFDLGDEPEYVVVNFTDGSNGTFEFYYGPSYDNNVITLPNGETVYVYAYLEQNDDGNICFVAGMAEHHFIEEEIYIEAVSSSENFNHLKNKISELMEWYSSEIEWCFSEMIWDLTHGYFTSFIYDIGYLFDTAIYLSTAIDEISTFIGYYI